MLRRAFFKGIASVIRARQREAWEYSAQVLENECWGPRPKFIHGRPWEPADDFGLQYWLEKKV